MDAIHVVFKVARKPENCSQRSQQVILLVTLDVKMPLILQSEMTWSGMTHSRIIDDVPAPIAQETLRRLKLNGAPSVLGYGLSRALNKTDIVVITKKRIQTNLPMRVGEEVLETNPTAKY